MRLHGVCRDMSVGFKVCPFPSVCASATVCLRRQANYDHRRARAKATPVATSRNWDSASPKSVRGSPSRSSESPFLLLLDVARVHSNDQGRNARVQRLQGVLHSQDGPLQAMFGGEVASSRREEKVGWKCSGSRSRPLLAAGLESPTTQRPAPNALTRRRATRSMWLTGRVSH